MGVSVGDENHVLDADPTTVSYDVTLRVSNAAGVSTCPITINIEACPCVDIAELGQACFGRNSSVLPAGQAQDNLRNNLEILRNNPSTYIIVEGYASPNERNAQAIAEFLAGHPKVTQVCYPGLETFKQHALAKSQASGFDPANTSYL